MQKLELPSIIKRDEEHEPLRITTPQPFKVKKIKKKTQNMNSANKLMASPFLTQQPELQASSPSIKQAEKKKIKLGVHPKLKIKKKDVKQFEEAKVP